MYFIHCFLSYSVWSVLWIQYIFFLCFFFFFPSRITSLFIMAISIDFEKRKLGNYCSWFLLYWTMNIKLIQEIWQNIHYGYKNNLLPITDDLAFQRSIQLRKPEYLVTTTIKNMTETAMTRIQKSIGSMDNNYNEVSASFSVYSCLT